jgi:hypothetical protein
VAKIYPELRLKHHIAARANPLEKIERLPIAFHQQMLPIINRIARNRICK